MNYPNFPIVFLVLFAVILFLGCKDNMGEYVMVKSNENNHITMVVFFTNFWDCRTARNVILESLPKGYHITCSPKYRL